MIRDQLRQWLRWDGPVMGFLDKAGQCIVLSFLWIVGSLPVVTLGVSTTALYYAVIKGVRREQGLPWREFLRSYRANLGRGTAATVILLVPAGLLGFNLRRLSAQPGRSPLFPACLVLLALLLFAWVYVCPVLSRFSIGVTKVWRLAFLMSLKFFPHTLWMALGTAALTAAQFFLLPIPTILILPALWCLLLTLPMERSLLHYMPPREENDDAWYYDE